MHPPAIEIQSVSKRYPNGVEALKETSLTARQGEVFGLLGANGAGKSTLVKILTSLVRPTKFEGLVLGMPLGARACRRRIGCLPEQAQFPRHLSAEEALWLAGRLHGMSAAAIKETAVRLLERVGLAAWAKHQAKDFSKGMRQRLGLAQALINDPDLIFLDEPTDGVDPVGRRDIRDLIFDLRRQGKTIFVNSHLLSELEVISDRVAILERGAVTRQGTVQELTSGGDRYLLTVEGELLDQPALAQLVSALGGAVSVPPGGSSTVVDIPTRRPQVVQPVIDELRRSGFIITSIALQRQSLEDYFLRAVGSSPASPPPVPAARQADAADPHATMH
jgi:ABC-2 type transport system ATP-binding protein